MICLQLTTFFTRLPLAQLPDFHAFFSQAMLSLPVFSFKKI